MIKIIINKNNLASSLRNRLIVISSVPITRSRRRNRRSNMIWIKTTIDITTFWAKAIRFISFRILKYHRIARDLHTISLSKTVCGSRVTGPESGYLRMCLEVANWSCWLVGFKHPISDAFVSLWSLSPFLTDENWNTTDCC